MPQPVTLEIGEGLATIRLGREHGNAINADLVDALSDACRRAAAASDVRAATLAASGKLFSPGLDLRELVHLDRAAMEQFLARFNDCILALYSFPKPLVAAIHGPAIAGGAVLALTADWRVLREGAPVGLNEIRVGVPLPFGVATILRETAAKLVEVALFGRNYTDAEAVAAGLVHEVAPASTFEATCRLRAEELAAKDSLAFSITKRYLRAAAIERIRAREAGAAHEFLDAWFERRTHARLSEIAADLARGK